MHIVIWNQYSIEDDFSQKKEVICHKKYFSSSRLASMSLLHAHIRGAVFHTLHIGHRNTRLFPLISYLDCYYVLATFVLSRDSSFTPFLISSPSYPFVAAAAASRFPSRSIPDCSHHCIPTRAPSALSDPSHRSNSDCVAIYCATMF